MTVCTQSYEQKKRVVFEGSSMNKLAQGKQGMWFFFQTGKT